MKIGIIGAGQIGAAAAHLFVRAGHQVAVSNSRRPDSLAELCAELGPRAHAAPPEEAARFGEVVLLAVPWRSSEALPRPTTVAGKVVIDAMNPYRPDFSLYDLGDSTSSEEVQKRLPGARLVKALNTIFYQHLEERGRTDLPPDERHAIFLAGDDAEAKAVVARLITEIGFAPIDTGPLREGGRRQQPGTPLYNKLLTGAQARALLEQVQDPDPGQSQGSSRG